MLSCVLYCLALDYSRFASTALETTDGNANREATQAGSADTCDHFQRKLACLALRCFYLQISAASFAVAAVLLVVPTPLAVCSSTRCDHVDVVITLAIHVARQPRPFTVYIRLCVHDWGRNFARNDYGARDDD